MKLPKVFLKIQTLILSPYTNSLISGSINKPKRQNIESPIPDLAQDLKSESHDGWTFEEGEFVIVTLSNTPYIDNETWLAPEVNDLISR